MKLLSVLGMMFTTLSCSVGSSEHSHHSHDCCTSEVYKHRPKVSPPLHVTNTSRLPPDLSCLRINNPAELTGYAFYQNVAFDSQIAINPKNPKNIVVVAQQDTLSNAEYNLALPLAVIVLYTFDGGITWNQSDLVLSRCQGSTNYKANNNFLSAYFPSVTFDREGNCYLLSTSYNLFVANNKPDFNFDEGNIVAKSIDGGVRWNQISAAFRDDGLCHFLDFSQIKADPYRKNTLYILSSDETCFVSSTCTDPNFTGTNNITFQRSVDAASSWSPPSLIASFVPENPDLCTPLPILNQIEVLPDHHKTLLVTSMIQESRPDQLNPGSFDRILAWRSKDNGNTWDQYTVANRIPHVLVVDPDSSNPLLPATDFITKDMTVSHCNGYAYIVYSDPQFSFNGQAGCVIRKSKDGGKTWSNPRPVNPKSLYTQAFLPTVAVAKDGTVGVLFYDFRNHTSQSDELETDVWLSLFDDELHHYYGEVRLTPESFDTRKSIRGYNGVDQANCQFDYYLSTRVGLKANGNNFEAAFVVTNRGCHTASIAQFPCDAFPLFTEDCNRQDIVYVHINREP